MIPDMILVVLSAIWPLHAYSVHVQVQVYMYHLPNLYQPRVLMILSFMLQMMLCSLKLYMYAKHCQLTVQKYYTVYIM